LRISDVNPTTVPIKDRPIFGTEDYLLGQQGLAWIPRDDRGHFEPAKRRLSMRHYDKCCEGSGTSSREIVVVLGIARSTPITQGLPIFASTSQGGHRELTERCDKRRLQFLTRPEIEAILDCTDRSTWLERGDHTLLLLAARTGWRGSPRSSISTETR